MRTSVEPSDLSEERQTIRQAWMQGTAGLTAFPVKTGIRLRQDCDGCGIPFEQELQVDRSGPVEILNECSCGRISHICTDELFWVQFGSDS